MFKKNWDEATTKAGSMREASIVSAAQVALTRSTSLNKEIADQLATVARGIQQFMSENGSQARNLLLATKRHVRLGGYYSNGRGEYVYLEGAGLQLYVNGIARPATIEEAAKFFVAFGSRSGNGVAAWLEYQLDMIAREVRLGY